VLLVHGWGGVGGQLATFVPSLQEHGCSVVAFDAPGHGASDGRESSLVHFTEAMLAVQQSMGPVRAVIAHSLGAAASTLAMTRGFEVNGAVFVAPPSHPSEWAQIFGRRFGVTEASIEYMRAEAERRIGFRWREIDTATLARSLRVPLLIVHDRDDEDVPISQGEELADAWPAAQFVTTIGLGHRRILSDPEVIRQSTAFIAESISEAVTV
jgi:pimeloyl-ACP methyl ester carboxylesterase